MERCPVCKNFTVDFDAYRLVHRCLMFGCTYQVEKTTEVKEIRTILVVDYKNKRYRRVEVDEFGQQTGRIVKEYELRS